MAVVKHLWNSSTTAPGISIQTVSLYKSIIGNVCTTEVGNKVYRNFNVASFLLIHEIFGGFIAKVTLYPNTVAAAYIILIYPIIYP